MNTVLCAVLLASSSSIPLANAPAVEIRYGGTISPLSRNAADSPAKQFAIYVAAILRERRELAFLVEENGAGGWPWPERFGLLKLDEKNQPTSQARIRLLHEYEGTPYPVEVRQPFFEHARKLASVKPGTRWKEGNTTYELVGSRDKNGRDCWEVAVFTPRDLRESVFVEKESGLLVSGRKRVVMGRGDRFLLKVDLESVRPLDAERWAEVEKPIRTLARLKKDLNREESRQKKPELTDEQLQTASAVYERLTRQAEGTPFNRYVAAIGRDVASQRQRTDDLAGLAKKYVGSRAPKLTLETVEGETVAPKRLEGNVVLLHFWEYRPEPLEEPYGQIGYLDFLHAQMKKRRLPVEIYGVAVDERLAADGNAAAARRSVRELQKFFNLGYPVAVDDGSLLRKLGDPRRFDAKLPLWVVIDTDDKVVHYHTGFYEIDPDEGLKQLERLIIDLVKKSRKR